MAEGISEAQFFVELERYDKVRRGFRSFEMKVRTLSCESPNNIFLLFNRIFIHIQAIISYEANFVIEIAINF
jgi:hypothetical protein